MHILFRLSGYAFHYRGSLVLAYTCLLGATILSLAIPRLLGITIDTVLSNPSLQTLIWLALAVLLTSTIRGLFAYGQTYIGEALSQKVAYDLRNAFYDRLQRLSFAYHDHQHTGNLMSRATADVEGIRMFINVGLIRSVYTVILLSTVSYLLLTMNWQLGLISLSFIPLVALWTAKVSRRLRTIWTIVQAETGQMTTVIQENLTGMKVVKAFGAEDLEERKFLQKAQNVAAHTYTASKVQAVNNSLVTLLFTAATGSILWYGGHQVISGILTPGELTQFILYMAMLAMPVRMIGFQINSFSRAISSGERIFEVLDAESPVKEREAAQSINKPSGNVRFQNVSFAYDSSTPALKNVDLYAEHGHMVALLGGPGSGKSTVAHLLPRFYEVTGGKITIDDVDIRDMTLASLRHNVGIVLQDVFLFTATFKENIAYGRVESPMEHIIRAAQMAQLHDFIESLPNGYDTWIGERGVTLSGGQRQRLAIARTILLNPSVLILDDSTSSVDLETERLIRQALTQIMEGRTTFVIAHRLSTVKSADLILVLKDGEIIERGTHQTLLELNGAYREIYELQLKPQDKSMPSGTPTREDT
jgi:ABC-type multidrug transport system fused ATPase/permease subunit